MSSKTIHTCDWHRNGCALPARKTITARAPARDFEGIFCDEHQPEVERALIGLGLAPIARVDSKRRRGYIGASGQTFTGAEARDWLQAEGHQVSTAGRIAGDLIELYARNH